MQNKSSLNLNGPLGTKYGTRSFALNEASLETFLAKSWPISGLAGGFQKDPFQVNPKLKPYRRIDLKIILAVGPVSSG